PPLFPEPQITWTRIPAVEPPTKRATACATSQPARSIKAACGKRYSSIASRSRAAISAPVTTPKGLCQNSPIAQLRPDRLNHPVDRLLNHLFVLPFAHDPDDRFRSRRPDEDPAPGADHIGGLLDRLLDRRVAGQRPFVGHPDVDEDLGKSLHHPGQS